MTNAHQPKALRLADALDAVNTNNADSLLVQMAARSAAAEQIGEIVALKEQRDELLAVLEHIEGLAMADDWRDLPEIVRIARAAIAKAGGDGA